MFVIDFDYTRPSLTDLEIFLVKKNSVFNKTAHKQDIIIV